MKRIRPVFILARHVVQLWRAGQLRFRLETFGVYYPDLPYRSPWWRVSPRGLYLLIRQAPSYARWLVEMDDLRRGGASQWWNNRRR